MQRVLLKCGIPILVFVATGMSVIGIWAEREVASAQQPSQFAIGPTPPSELNPTGGGPAQATLQQAAEFAWEEFFAFNWPAGPQGGQTGQRDTPSSTCHFGDQSSSCAGPLVWETFRGKVEIFPGDGNPPPGYSATAPSYGYDALPQYNYGTLHPVTTEPCSGGTPPPTAWVNLDETDQITEDSMYAGVAPVSVTSPPKNSAPQLIRFLAKANRQLYEYVAQRHWWDGTAPTENTASYVKNNMTDPPDGDNYVLLPPNPKYPGNTIEVKAGWRVLNPSEIASGKFHTATVRYYERVNESAPNPRCYEQATFGLVSLHIIQKTKMAPYFIYATFEQADNILNDKAQSVEDVDGSLLPSPPPSPTTPSVTLNDSSNSAVPPQVVTVPATANYCTPDVSTHPSNQLSYLNASEYNPGLPTNGYICINKRDNDIPPVIIDTNKRAHTLIQSYSSANGITNSVWQYYKLINVQYLPIDKDYAGLYGNKPGENDFLTAHNPSTYHLANIVVETNRPLQLFSGSLPGNGANSEYESQFSGGPGIHRNMFYAGAGYNMGGCMGCHGAQGQGAGGDFSVIMARGPVKIAETPAPPTPTGAAAISRNRLLVKYH